MTGDIEGWLRDSTDLRKVIPIKQVARTSKGDVVVASAEIWPDEIVFRLASAGMHVPAEEFVRPQLSDDVDTVYSWSHGRASGSNLQKRAYQEIGFQPAPPDGATLVTLVIDPQRPGLVIPLNP